VRVKVLRALWVRIASSVRSARDLFLLNQPLVERTLEAMRTQGYFHRSAKLDARAPIKHFLTSAGKFR